ncbi:MAG: DNA recombination protein RmuC [candidate division WOR-3 bacterium]|nr:DNA recombination protein RmuC [candidate division WOR-3 bacterium]
MIEALSVLAGLVVGGVVSWLWSRAHTRSVLQRRYGELETKLSAAESTAAAHVERYQRAETALAEAQDMKGKESNARIAAETRLSESQKALGEQRKLLEEALVRMKESFDALAASALKSNNQAFIELAHASLEGVLMEAKGDLGTRQEAISGLVRPLKESLDKFDSRIQDLERVRQEAYGGITQQLDSLRLAHQGLQKETLALVNALKRPQVKGRWGEMTLRNVVELAGMSDRCDFSEQPSFNTEEGRQRPDLTVNLPGGRVIAVDAKVPLAAFIEAFEAGDDETRKMKLSEHTRLVRAHMKDLASRAYWSHFKTSPDIVVMFLPGESFFSAAVEQDQALMEDGFKSRVMIATPTTLIALLRSVALSWQQQVVAENSQRIWDAGMELYERIATFTEHIDDIRAGLDRATGAYNRAVGSWDSRISPSARKLRELGGGVPKGDLAELKLAETSLRELPHPSGSEGSNSAETPA